TGEAVKLAAAYQLVTPVSGAVVLETAEQYQRAGLEPVPPNSVPTIPEPEEWLLMFVALAVLLWMTCRRRFAWRST
ncbi:MAG: PEP-CTERM sorting domain-containing protein, partial [Blastocatellia bacterium]